MLFVKNDDLRVGMRLAKPIYNKKGVLLYERDSKITSQGIESVRNFGLIGIYVLEPAEPLPPMTQDDIDFEKFQSVEVFEIMDELQSIAKSNKHIKIYTVAQTIIKAYGRLDHKINFVQNLRSANDFIYKHSLNVAMLCAMISHKMNMKPTEQEELVTAAIVHAVGIVSKDEKNNPTIMPEDEDLARRLEYSGIAKIEAVFLSSPSIKRAVLQAFRETNAFYNNEDLSQHRVVDAAKILIVADEYDKFTAMNSVGETPRSEIAALKHFLDHPEIYDEKVVNALIESVNFLAEGCCVELSNGEKGLVIQHNPKNVLRPMILVFSSNKIVDLAQTLYYGDLEIVDIMKTLDNRHVMDMDLLNQFK